MVHTSINNGKHRDVLLYTLLFAIALLLVYIRAMPCITALPSTDQGLWLYMGKAMLSGQVPYRDIWDQKGPVIYFIEALGLALAGKSAWGVWVLEYCCMLHASVWGFISLTRAFGQKAAALGTLLWIFSLVFVMEEGNFTETYALAVAFMLFATYLNTCQAAPSRRAATLIGVFGALCFFLRPNLIGALLACVASWTVIAATSHRWRTWAINIVFAGLGFICIAILISGYFIYHHALGAMYDQMLRFNMKSICINPVKSRIHAAYFGLQLLAPLSIIATLMWCAGVTRIRRIACRQDVFNNILLFAVISWPIEFGLALVAGNKYYHYFVVLLLPICLLITWGVSILLRGISSLPDWLEPDAPTTVTAARKENLLSLAVLLLILVPFINAQKPFLYYLLKPATLRAERVPIRYTVADYITSHTSPADGVYIWGYDFTILYATRRHSPIKYPDVVPFITPKYDPRPHVSSFLYDLTRQPPRVMIDMAEAEATVSMAQVFRNNDIPQAREIWAYICRNYQPAELAPGVVVYQRKMQRCNGE